MQFALKFLNFSFATLQALPTTVAISPNEQHASHPAAPPAQPTTTAALPKPGPTLVKVSATLVSPSKYNIASVFFIWLQLDRAYVKIFSICAPITAEPAEISLGEESQQKGQRAKAPGEKAQVSSVRSSGPEAGGQRSTHGLLIRPTSAAAAAVSPAPDPQSAAAATQVMFLTHIPGWV